MSTKYFLLNLIQINIYSNSIYIYIYIYFITYMLYTKFVDQYEYNKYCIT